MKMSTRFAALVALMLAGTNLSAAEISRSQLAEIGLPGMKVMSPQEAMKVRGMGTITIVSGFSHVSGAFFTIGPYLNAHSGVSLSIGAGAIAGGASSASAH